MKLNFINILLITMMAFFFSLSFVSAQVNIGSVGLTSSGVVVKKPVSLSDTNATSACTGGQVLFGNGSCGVITGGGGGGDFSFTDFQPSFNNNISNIDVGNFSFTDFQSSYDSNQTNIFNQDLNTSSNVNFGNVTLGSGGFFSGLFNWLINLVDSSPAYLTFNGSTLSFNENKLNGTISDIANGTEFNFNQSDIEFNFNQSNIEFNFNQSNIEFNFNQSDIEFNFNQSDIAFNYNQTGLERNIFNQDLNTSSNVNFGNVTLQNGGFFTGVFNWIINQLDSSPAYLAFNGSTLSFDENKLNGTISDIANGTEFNFNQSDIEFNFNQSNIEFNFNQSNIEFNFNQSDIEFNFNQSNIEFNFNQSDIQFNFNQSDIQFNFNQSDIAFNYNQTGLEQNIFDQTLNTTSNVSFGNVTSSGTFNGLFNWTINALSSIYLTFNGNELTFNENKLNGTISDIANGTEFNFNQSDIEFNFNQSNIEFNFNQSDIEFNFNQSDIEFNFNQSIANETNRIQNLTTYDCGSDEYVIGIHNNGTIDCLIVPFNFNQSDIEFNFNQSDIEFNFNQSDIEFNFNQSAIEFNFNQSDIQFNFNQSNIAFNYNQTGLERNIFDQDLNTTDNVQFKDLDVTGNYTGAGLFTQTATGINQDLFSFTGSSSLTGERTVFLIEDIDSGGGGQDESESLHVFKSSTFKDADDGSAVLALTLANVESSISNASIGFIFGRHTDNGQIFWGIDANHSIFTAGSIYAGVIGTDCGGTSAPCFNSPNITLSSTGEGNFTGEIFVNGGTAVSTFLYNQTGLGIFNYNQTELGEFNFNQSNIEFNFNQSDIEFNFNQSDIQFNFNQSDIEFNFNQSNIAFNYNQTGLERNIFDQDLNVSSNVRFNSINVSTIFVNDSSSNKALHFGSSTSSGKWEFEDGGVCIGMGGCVAPSSDGRLVVEGSIHAGENGNTAGEAYNSFGNGDLRSKFTEINGSEDVFIAGDMEIRQDVFVRGFLDIGDQTRIGLGTINTSKINVGRIIMNTSSGLAIHINKEGPTSHLPIAFSTADVPHWFLGLSDSQDAGDGTQFFIGTDPHGNGTNGIWLEKTGFVGMGTTNPTSILEIIGNFNLTGNIFSGPVLSFGSTTSSGKWEFEDGGVCIGMGGCTAPSSDGRLVVEGSIHAGENGNTAGEAYNSFGDGDQKGRAEINGSEDVFIAGDLEVNGQAFLAGSIFWIQGDIAETLATKNSRENDFCNGDLKCLMESVDDDLGFGDVVCIDVSGSRIIMKCNESNSRLVVGVITDTAVLTIEPSLVTGYPVSLAGIVSTKVTNENGEIFPGDLLVSASKEGYAMKGINPKQGTIIGKAFDFCDEKEDECKIPVFVALG